MNRTESVYWSHMLVRNLFLLYKGGQKEDSQGLWASWPFTGRSQAFSFKEQGRAWLHSPNESCFWNQHNSSLIHSLCEFTVLKGSQQPKILILSVSQSISVISKHLPTITVSQISHLSHKHINQ